MKTRFKVLEYRGAGIEYTAFEGTHAECKQWLRDNCHEETDTMDDSVWVANDATCVNENGVSFKYYMYVSFEGL